MTLRPIALATAAVALLATMAPGAQTKLTTTAHPAIPARVSQYWLVPDAALARGGKPAADNAAALAAPALAQYSRYRAAVALHDQGRHAEAAAILSPLFEAEPEGYLTEAAGLRLAAVYMSMSEAGRAADVLDDLADEKTLLDPEEVLLRLAEAEDAAGDRGEALAAYRRVFYDYPLSTQAAEAEERLARLQTVDQLPPDRFTLERDRAERLFEARRWAQARAAFAPLARAAQGNDRTLIALRLAECDYYLDRHRASRDALRPLLEGGPYEVEARFFHLSATRGTGDHDAYVRLARGLVADHPQSRWAEETLNNLASHYVQLDQEDQADLVFRELTRRFPKGRYGERAAWKIGWLAYKSGGFARTADVFETAAATYPRADFRPSWLYWAGRSRDQAGDTAAAHARYRLLVSDYANTYYGRLASRLLASRREAPVQPIVAVEALAAPAPPVPTEPVIRALIVAELYDEALRETQYAQRAWGDAAVLQATVAWIRHRRGLSGDSMDRFADVRGAITLMRRAYPQFMAAGGEKLPGEVLRVIFPLDYWPLIKKYSDAHGLDPYLMTALISQESTFTPDVRSFANAYGLMQLIPPTARAVSRQLGIRYSQAVLTQPETNIRLGMKYFKDLVEKFGGAHYALAGYNAGPHRVVRWKAERPGFSQDEFIDDIPFQETQNYVKRILGTADDYRLLYASR